MSPKAIRIDPLERLTKPRPRPFIHKAERLLLGKYAESTQLPVLCSRNIYDNTTMGRGRPNLSLRAGSTETRFLSAPSRMLSQRPPGN
jgi:hypothetical protein